MPLKFHTERRRNIFGKLGNDYQCTIPGTDWCHTAASKELAEAGLLDRLKLQATFVGRQYIKRGKTTTWILTYADGWQYTISPDDKPRQNSSCLLSCKTEREAREAMDAHFTQHEDNQ